MTTFETVRELLGVQLELDPELIQMETTFDDLGADHIDMIDLAMTVEDEFQMELPDEVLETLQTVGDIVQFLESK